MRAGTSFAISRERWLRLSSVMRAGRKSLPLCVGNREEISSLEQSFYFRASRFIFLSWAMAQFVCE